MKKLKILLNTLIIILAIVFAYSVFSHFRLRLNEKKSIEIYSEIKKSSTKPNIKKDENTFVSDIDFDKLKEINKDIFAWIRSDDKKIDYPLVQCGDNDKYLHTLANGEENLMGSVFMDYRNKSLDDRLVLIYAHTTNDETMFGSLNDFKKADTKKVFSFFTPEKKFTSQPVLAGIISGDTEIDPKNFDDFEKRKEFFNFIRKNSVYDTGYELKEDDRMINLLTCTYERKNVRLVILTIVDKP